MLTLFFTGFILLIIALMALDLGVFHRKAKVIGIREALRWTGVWVSLALFFNLLIYFMYGHNWLGWNDAYESGLSGQVAAQKFLQCYIVELSLSMDNLFVFATILTFFCVPLQQQHRVLVWGILGAIVLRGVMIGLGAALVQSFDWIMYVFGLLLLWTAWKMLRAGDAPIEPERNVFIRLARRLYPCTTDLHGSKFFVRVDGALHMTPMFLALILVDIADVMFAIDSIPAAFGFTNDTFIVFTSNIFAIMGLRSMYFALVGLMDRFRYLKPSIVILLAYIGLKMLLHHHYKIPDAVSLAVIGTVLASGVLASVAFKPRARVESDAEPPFDRSTSARRSGNGEAPKADLGRQYHRTDSH